MSAFENRLSPSSTSREHPTSRRCERFRFNLAQQRDCVSEHGTRAPVPDVRGVDGGFSFVLVAQRTRLSDERACIHDVTTADDDAGERSVDGIHCCRRYFLF